MTGRVALGSAGALLVLFGAFRLVTEVPVADLAGLAVWLAAAVALHDGVLAPLTALAGAALARVLPGRARRYVSGALVAGVGISVIALPLVLREGTQPAAKALLRQHYAAHLAWLWLLVGVAAGLLYTMRVVRDARRG